MTYEASILTFEAPCALLIPPTTAHGFRWRENVTDGWVVSFTEDVAQALGRALECRAGAAEGIGRDAGRAALRRGGDQAHRARFAPSSTKSISSRAKAIGWRCAACWR